MSGSLRAGVSGRIRVQAVAIIMLGLSVSMVLSAYRSLGREFSGMILGKSSEQGIAPSFWVYITDPELLKDEVAVGLSLRGGSTIPKRRVGVSKFVFEKAGVFQRISKASFSPFIKLDEETHLDLGLQWMTWGVFGIVASFFIFFQFVPEGSPEIQA